MTELDTNWDVSHYCTDTSEQYFAQIVGCIESVVIGDDFAQVQTNFLEKHYREFDDDDENKLVYMDVFKSYLETVEKFIEEQLVRNVPGFDLRDFQKLLEHKPEELDSEIYEILSTFWDFNTFKRMFLEYKHVKEGNAVDLSKAILITKYSI